MRKRSLKTKLNTKQIIDVIGASLLVQKSPMLIDMIMPLSPQVRALAGVGVGYMAGAFLKRPDMANASIALGVVDFVSPFVDQLFGGVGGGLPLNTSGGTVAIMPPKGMPAVDPSSGIETERLGSYVTLNDYVANPSKRLSFNQYANSYGY